MQKPEVRKLFQLARARIKDSVWEEIVFPPPKSAADIEREKTYNAEEEKMWAKRGLIEDAVNDFFEQNK